MAKEVLAEAVNRVMVHVICYAHRSGRGPFEPPGEGAVEDGRDSASTKPMCRAFATMARADGSALGCRQCLSFKLRLVIAHISLNCDAIHGVFDGLMVVCIACAGFRAAVVP